MGLPRLWGRVGGVAIEGGVVGGPVRGKEDMDQGDEGVQMLGFVWTAAYYFILIAGAVAWWSALWVLSESGRELVKMG